MGAGCNFAAGIRRITCVMSAASGAIVVFLPYILYNNVSILPSSRFPASYLVFVTNLLSVYLQNIFIIPGKNLREYLVFVGIRCTFAPAFGKGASLFERSVSVFRFPRLFFQKKNFGKNLEDMRKSP